MPPTPTPTTPEQASILFYILLALVIGSTAVSIFALYRVARKTQAEEAGSKAGATETIQRVVATFGKTYDDLVSDVREMVEIQIEAKYKGQIAILTTQVEALQLKAATDDAERQKMRQDYQTERENWERTAHAIDRRYQIEIEKLQAGIKVLIAQMKRHNITPEWEPSSKG